MKTPLVPRKVLFGNQDYANPQISPDGRYVSWLAPSEGVMNVWVAPRADLSAARPVTDDRLRGVRNYGWTYTSRNILYLQDKGGDENWQIHQVDVERGRPKNLTPFADVQARVLQTSHKYPHEVLIGLNNRDPQFHDVWRMNFLTGEKWLVCENNEWAGFETDDDLKVRFASRYEPNGEVSVHAPDGDRWKPFLTFPKEDAETSVVLDFNETNDLLYLFDSRGRDTAALVAIDLANGDSTVLAADPRADISGLFVKPIKRTIEAAASNYERVNWEVLDPEIQPHLDALAAVCDGDMTILSRSMDDRWWTVEFVVDDGPDRFYLYQSETRSATFLSAARRELGGYTFANMKPVVIKARDGLPLVSYLTVPAEGAAPYPMVLLVHGGPWSRDAWGWHGEHQWLANRGYAVLSVNFRGSTGFGKNHVNGGDLEWGRKMHNDLVDAVQWAVDEGHAAADRVAIMGGSYGGYATLAGMTFTPELFACGVDIVGPSNLITLIESIPPYWAPALQAFKDRIGDPDSAEGHKLLEERSPVNFADRICRPLLIAQGANDPRVKQAESDQIVDAMKAKDIPVTYLLYGDEGHGFARPENNLSFYAVTEAFLAQHLGGRVEKAGSDLENSSIEIREGADQVKDIMQRNSDS